MHATQQTPNAPSFRDALTAIRLSAQNLAYDAQDRFGEALYRHVYDRSLAWEEAQAGWEAHGVDDRVRPLQWVARPPLELEDASEEVALAVLHPLADPGSPIGRRPMAIAMALRHHPTLGRFAREHLVAARYWIKVAGATCHARELLRGYAER